MRKVDREQSLDLKVLLALEALGGGVPLSAVALTVDSTAFKSEVQRALHGLQRLGLAFAHDGNGTLSVWGGIPGQRARYWSTKGQIQNRYGYTDRDFNPRAEMKSR